MKRLGLILALAWPWWAGMGVHAKVPAQAPEPAPQQLQLAWLGHDDQVHTAVLGPTGQAPASRWQADQLVPLGSLWKLLAYAELSERGRNEPAYTCQGQDKEEVYCCHAGERIDRGTALWKSCGLYFEPARTHGPGEAWGTHLPTLPPTMSGLLAPGALHSRSLVPVADWLRWLAQWPTATQQAAAADLLAYWLQGPGQSALGEVGSRLRLKTFTLERQDRQAVGQRWAGASGWLSDGRPVWMAAQGSSKQVLPTWGPIALRYMDEAEPPSMASAPPSATCVDVRFFARYPVEAIIPTGPRAGVAPLAPPNTPIATPLPKGRYEVRFVNGVKLPIESQGDLLVSWPNASAARPSPHANGDPAPGPILRGRYALDDYIARVIDREGSGQPQAAARALAVAARSYVLSHGQSTQGCLSMDDSSTRQRVAPRPASPAARAAAQATADLVLSRSAGLYHSTRAAPQLLSWQLAVRQAEQGQRFDQILAQAYPGDSLRTTSGSGGTSCEALPLAQQWLDRQRSIWQRQLQGEAGYGPSGPVQVCRLQNGLPHALRQTGRLYVRGLQSLDDRLTLAHEYLHLAFSGHPRGSDETFIEARARQLLGMP
jgi:uncharacterized protein YfaQ (DUF2300 family)